MTFRGLMVHGALAAVSCLVAYSAWRSAQQGEEAVGEDASAQVVAFELARSDLRSVQYVSKQRTVRLDVAQAGQPHWVAVTSKTRVLPPKNRPVPPTDRATPADGGPAGAAPREGTAVDGGAAPASRADGGPNDGALAAPPPREPEYRQKLSHFVANEGADELLKTLAPFKVIRRLGTLDDRQKTEFELDEAEATLTLSLREGSKEFTIGARTFGGGNHYYILDEAGEGYLLHSEVIRGLEMAQTRLKQRDLNRFEMAEVASVKLSAPAGQRVLEHRHRQTPQEETWVAEGAAADAKNKAYSNWMSQLKRLRALEYPSREAVKTFQPSGDPALRVEYFDERGDSLGYAEIAQQQAAESPRFVAQSEATQVWVRISGSVAEQLLGDLGDILGGTPSAEP